MRRALSLAAILLAAPGVARADDTHSLAGLLDESVATTASQRAENTSTAPATTTVITGEELQRFGLYTLEDAINFFSLGMTAGPATDLGAHGIAVPGDSGNHFLLLIDGHAMNEPVRGGARFDRVAGIPMELVDHIELVVGPGSVLYGSNAMFGVINVVTKSRESLRGGRAIVESQLLANGRVAALGSLPLFGSGEVTGALQYYHQSGPSLDLGTQNLGIDPTSLRPARTDRDGPEDGLWGGRAERSTFARVPSAFLRVRLGDWELGMRGVLAHEGDPFAPADFDDPNNASRSRRVSGDLKYKKQLTPSLHVSVRGYMDGADTLRSLNTSRVSACLRPGVTTCTYEQTDAAHWMGAEVQARYDWFRDGRLTSLAGVDARRRWGGSKVDLRDFDSGRLLTNTLGNHRVQDETLGAYVQQTYSPLRGLDLNGGARLDYDERFDPVISPRVAVAGQVWGGGTLRLAYAEAFRAPSFYESYAFGPTQARANALRPETVATTTGTFEQKFAAHRVLFGLFHASWQDLVENRTLTEEERAIEIARRNLAFATAGYAATQFRNHANLDSYGFDGALQGGFASNRLRYGVNVMGAFARKDDILGPLPSSARFTANARLSYEPGGDLPTLALAGYVVPSRLANRGAEAGFDPVPYAPTLLTVRATVSGRVPWVPGLDYRVSANAVTASRGTTIIGPTQDAISTQRSAELVPLDPFRVTVGLTYTFGDRH